MADAVVVEAKSVEALAPIHEAQLLTYLKLGGWKVGLLINFNVEVLKTGIRRKVLGFEEEHELSLRNLCVSLRLCGELALVLTAETQRYAEVTQRKT